MDANDCDFVIPTLRPLSRGSSRHSILASASHDAQHSKAPRQPDHFTRSSSSRKTSFNLVRDPVDLLHAARPHALDMPSQSPASPPQQLQSRRSSAGEAVSERKHSPVSMQQSRQAPVPDQEHAASGQSPGGEALDQTTKHSLQGQSSGHLRATSTVGKMLPSRSAQKRDKAVRPI